MKLLKNPRNRPANGPITDLPHNKLVSFRDGKFEVPHIGQWYANLSDPYYVLLTIPWPGFVLLVVAAYLFLNASFAGLFLLGGNCIQNATPGSFTDAFFFSVQSFASIGYGYFLPSTPYAHTVVTLEAIVSILCISLMTGLAFARFARPTARVTFSKVLVVTHFEGVPTLQFRAANRRHNQILEAEVTMHLMIDETTPEGTFMRRLYDLPLVRSQTPTFILSWTVMHKITPESPLFKETAESLNQKRAMFLVSLKGIDETVSQQVHARMTYGTPDLIWNARLVDIIEIDSEGHRCFNFTRFHDYELMAT